jgi:hypothetical protein
MNRNKRMTQRPQLSLMQAGQPPALYERLYRMYARRGEWPPVFSQQAEMEREGRAEWQRLYPRRRKFAWAQLPEAYRVALLAKHKAILTCRWEVTRRNRDRIGCVLSAIAATAPMTPQSTVSALRQSSTDTYRSQGFGAMQYARGALVWPLELLRRRGFAAEIVRTRHYQYRDAYGYLGDHADFELRANAADWQLDALMRLGTLEDMTATQFQHRLNPRVFNPFIPYGVFAWDR